MPSGTNGAINQINALLNKRRGSFTATGFDDALRQLPQSRGLTCSDVEAGLRRMKRRRAITIRTDEIEGKRVSTVTRLA